MNILFSSLSGHNLTPRAHYHRVLVGSGHSVFPFALPAALDDVSQGAWVEPGFAPETTLKSLAGLSGFEPDLFLYIEPNGLIPLEVVSAFNLFEHLRKEEILHLLKLTYQALKPGGRLLAVTPNGLSPFAGATRYWDFSHETGFTPAS